MLFVTFVGMANKKETGKKIFNKIIIKDIDSSNCSKTFSFDLNGNVTSETSKKVIEYILNKKGICDVKIDVLTKRITLDVIEDMDFESIKGLVNYTNHLFLLEDINHSTESK